MPIHFIKIEHFRNFSSVEARLHPEVNLFYGENGSGKTSFLEAIYLCSFGRSFRTHLTKRVIQDDKNGLLVFLKFLNTTQKLHNIGVSRDYQGINHQKLDGEFVSVAEISKILPVQILNNDSFSLLTEGPKIRRQFIDLGVFHVEPSFLTQWRKNQKALQQRNLAIRQRQPLNVISAWNEILIKTANKVTEARQKFLQQFIPPFKSFLQDYCYENVKIDFYQGWSKDLQYDEILQKNISKDLELGYTFYGIHRADLKITINRKPIVDALSRGQQKLFVWLMCLSQARLVNQLAGKQAIFLIDDIHAELDKSKVEQFIQCLKNLEGQFFISGISESQLASVKNVFKQHKMFHVKHNTVLDMPNSG